MYQSRCRIHQLLQTKIVSVLVTLNPYFEREHGLETLDVDGVH